MEYIWDYLNEKTYNTKVGLYKYKREYKFIINNAINDFTNVLDIAGGSGRFALPLFEYSKKITVLDINQSALDLLRERNCEIDIICSDFIQFQIQDTYSLLLCIEAIEYFEDWEVFFDKVNKVLLHDGLFIFTYANPNSWRYYLRKIKHWKNVPTHYNEMSISNLIKTLYKSNLEVDKIEGMNWIPLPLSSNSILVTFFAIIENIFKLKNWHSQSPWLLIAVKKRKHINDNNADSLTITQ